MFYGIGILNLFLNSQKNTCIGAPRAAILFKMKLQDRRFTESFAQFLRAPFLKNTSARLLLEIQDLFVKYWLFEKYFKIY